jgi:hypothetical protein
MTMANEFASTYISDFDSQCDVDFVDLATLVLACVIFPCQKVKSRKRAQVEPMIRLSRLAQGFTNQLTKTYFDGLSASSLALQMNQKNKETVIQTLSMSPCR